MAQESGLLNPGTYFPTHQVSTFGPSLFLMSVGGVDGGVPVGPLNPTGPPHHRPPIP